MSGFERILERNKMNLLFIGNSYTLCNQMTEMIAHLGEVHTQNRPGIRVVATGGWYLKTHWEDGEATEAIRERGWDYVVLQDQSLGPIEHPKWFETHARLLHKEIAAAGATTIFYQTWGRQHKPEMVEQLRQPYATLAADLGALLSPVGTAWGSLLCRTQEIALHVEDESHPTIAGSYLAACVHFATIFKASPVGLPYCMTLKDEMKVNLPVEVGIALQEAAEEAVTSLSSPPCVNAE